MKLAIRSLAAAFVVALAACSAPVPTDPTAAAPTAGPSSDVVVTTQTDTTTNRGPNLFGSGN